MLDITCLEEKFNPFKLYNYFKYKINFAREHPNYFYADGLTVFVGPQGSGKTLSAVNYTYNLLKKYPSAKLVTNLMLKDYPIVEFKYWLDTLDIKLYAERLQNLTDIDLEKELYEIYKHDNDVFSFNNSDDLQKYENDDRGVIYLIDEIQLYFNSLESKNINPDVMVQISQQRKQRKHIIATSQVFGRMAKPFREQFSAVVRCTNYFSILQKNDLIDRDSIEDSTSDSNIKGKIKKRSIFLHSPDYYARYDTYYTISRTKFVSGELKVRDIYDRVSDIRLQLTNTK